MAGRMEHFWFERATQLSEITYSLSSMREKLFIIRSDDMERMRFSP